MSMHAGGGGGGGGERDEMIPISALFPQSLIWYEQGGPVGGRGHRGEGVVKGREGVVRGSLYMYMHVHTHTHTSKRVS